ncbi:cytidylyltransferase domain-containing protein [Treponema socranskii]|uniref:acylneuraminate cytidylyltransferase family protein n=1 Tax=Treponema socranskii TaxID=53419 RepID=UPI003D6DF370
MKNILITICGRAGSKGFKNKNLKTFLGVPLVYYTASIAEDFKTRLAFECKTTICLNTDSKELQNLVSAKYKDVEIIVRSAELSGDKVPKCAVWHNSLDILEAKFGKQFDYVIDLDITSPLRQIDDVVNAYKLKLETSQYQMIYSVCKSRRNPYFNMVKIENGFAIKFSPSNFTTRQEAPSVYDMNASIYVMDASALRNDKDDRIFVTSKMGIYEMYDTAVLDIDSEQDFELMEIIAKYLFEKIDGFKKMKELAGK